MKQVKQKIDEVFETFFVLRFFRIIGVFGQCQSYDILKNTKKTTFRYLDVFILRSDVGAACSQSFAGQ
jgi:hypothetical protein